MEKIFVNMSSWVGISGGAIHTYAKISKNPSEKNIYQLCDNSEWGEGNEELERRIDAKEAAFLNKKDGKGSLWKEGMITTRFNSPEEIREIVLALYPENDIAFLWDWELRSEDMDIVVRSKEEIKYTGQKIQIQGFRGFSSNFKNLTEGSVHRVIETPERYKDKPSLYEGVWVEGVYEPAKVLSREYITVK